MVDYAAWLLTRQEPALYVYEDGFKDNFDLYTLLTLSTACWLSIAIAMLLTLKL